MTTTTIPAPRRIGIVRYVLADLTIALFGPDHPGASHEWVRQLREAGPAARAAVRHPADMPTVVIPPVRRPIAALTARPHVEQVCPLDACPLDLGPLEPAVLFDDDRYAVLAGGAA